MLSILLVITCTMSADNIPNGTKTNGGINQQEDVALIKDESSLLPKEHFTLSVNLLLVNLLSLSSTNAALELIEWRQEKQQVVCLARL
jgi:hypothetical protein